MLNQAVDKVLIVDDEPQVGLYLKEALTIAGYGATLVSNGESALEILAGEKDFSVVLLDVNMPGLDGVTVLKRLQRTQNETAVIMMAGQGSEELAVECMKHGADDFISKPFTQEDLLQRITGARLHRRDRIEKRRLQQENENFILMLSHDMKNPLTAVIGSIDIIREGCLGTVNEEQKEYLQSAIGSCNEVVTMIDNLLDIRKFEAGKMQLAIRNYRAHELVGSIADQFKKIAKHEGIGLSVQIEPSEAEIAVDKNVLNRILGNLLGNALKFSPAEENIAISCKTVFGKEARKLGIPAYAPIPPGFLKKGCFTRLVVSDAGNGIPRDELGHIFDRCTHFNQNTIRERGGAGLGIAYCKLATESFHGMIWAESKSKKGNDFIILLPCNSSPEAQSPPPSPP